MAIPENILKQISSLEEEKENLLEENNINKLNKIDLINKQINELKNILNDEFEYISNSINNSKKI